MARRGDHTRDEIKQMAITAGQEIIIEEGFANFSARKVAREIGYTIGTIYNVFENHDDLIFNINAVTLQDLKKFIESKITKKGIAAIKQIANSYIEFAHQDFNRWSTLFEYNSSVINDLPDWYQNKINDLFFIVEEHFADFLAEEEQVKTAAKTIWAGIHGICQLSLTGKLDVVGVKSIEELANSLIDNYLKGLSK